MGNDRQVIELARLKRINGLYVIETRTVDRVMKLSTPRIGTLQEWHASFAHLNIKDTRNILKQKGIKYEENNAEDECLECLTTKMTARPFSSPENKAKRPCDIIAVDLFYVNKDTYDDKRYGAVYLDRYSLLALRKFGWRH
jgi:hypothetical protein